MIAVAEKRLEIELPASLKAFYHEYGYGFLDSLYENVNRIMDPLSITDYIRKTGDYEQYPNVKDFSFDGHMIPFFEVNLGIIFFIELNTSDSQKIYYADVVIAESFQEFLDKYTEDEFYYTDLKTAAVSKSETATEEDLWTIGSIS